MSHSFFSFFRLIIQFYFIISFIFFILTFFSSSSFISTLFPVTGLCLSCDLLLYFSFWLYLRTRHFFFGPLTVRLNRLLWKDWILEIFLSSVSFFFSIGIRSFFISPKNSFQLFISFLYNLGFPLLYRHAAIHSYLSIWHELFQTNDRHHITHLITKMLLFLIPIYISWDHPAFSPEPVVLQTICLELKAFIEILVSIIRVIGQQLNPDRSKSAGIQFWWCVRMIQLGTLGESLLSGRYVEFVMNVIVVGFFGRIQIFQFLEPDFFNALPEASTKGVCAECQGSLENHGKKLGCGHEFHECCLYEIAVDNRICPVCGSDIATPEPPRNWERVKQKWIERITVEFERLSEAVDLVRNEMELNTEEVPEESFLEEELLPKVLEVLRFEKEGEEEEEKEKERERELEIGESIEKLKEKTERLAEAVSVIAERLGIEEGSDQITGQSDDD
jgi:hypothetical protein